MRPRTSASTRRSPSTEQALEIAVCSCSARMTATAERSGSGKHARSNGGGPSNAPMRFGVAQRRRTPAHAATAPARTRTSRRVSVMHGTAVGSSSLSGPVARADQQARRSTALAARWTMRADASRGSRRAHDRVPVKPERDERLGDRQSGPASQPPPSPQESRARATNPSRRSCWSAIERDRRRLRVPRRGRRRARSPRRSSSRRPRIARLESTLASGERRVVAGAQRLDRDQNTRRRLDERARVGRPAPALALVGPAPGSGRPDARDARTQERAQPLRPRGEAPQGPRRRARRTARRLVETAVGAAAAARPSARAAASSSESQPATRSARPRPARRGSAGSRRRTSASPAAPAGDQSERRGSSPQSCRFMWLSIGQQGVVNAASKVQRAPGRSGV